LLDKKCCACLAIAMVTFPLLVSCGDGNDEDDIRNYFNQIPTVEPIESTVKTAVPLGYAASVAMASVNGAVIPNTSLSNTCTTYPCVATMVIILSPGILPVTLDGIENNGEIFVAGLWSSAQQAIMTMVFTDINAGSNYLSIHKISTIPVTQTGSTLSIVYAGVDMNIDSDPDFFIDLNDTQIQTEYERLNQPVSDDPEINVDMDAWVISVDLAGTSDDFTDDTYSILGGGQYFQAGAADVSVLQLGLLNLQITPDCSLNPIEGLAVLQEVEIATGERFTWPKIGQALMQFNPTCNGRASVLLGTGSFTLVSGEEIDLGFND